MEILEMIQDWRNGCDLAKSHPIECHACTIKLIDAIELKERIHQHSGCITPRLHEAVDKIQSASVNDKVRGDSCVVKVSDIQALLNEFFRLDKTLQHLKPHIVINPEEDYRCT